MKKIILSLAVSLDGFIEGPNGEIDWITFDAETGKALNKFIQEIDTILYGRISYEKWGNYIPSDTSADFEKDFYRKTSKMKKYVFSGSKGEFEGNPTVIQSDIARKVQNLKREPGKDIWLYGGAGLISEFANLDLIDEYRIAIIPILIGEGKPMLKEIKQRIKLKLLEAEGSTSGAVGLRYERIR
jgi:dihydrofolate reductase